MFEFMASCYDETQQWLAGLLRNHPDVFSIEANESQRDDICRYLNDIEYLALEYEHAADFTPSDKCLLLIDKTRLSQEAIDAIQAIVARVPYEEYGDAEQALCERLKAALNATP